MPHTIPAPDFDLEKTLNSGQVFHWVAGDDGFYGVIGDLPVFVRQHQDQLTVEGGAPETVRAGLTKPSQALPPTRKATARQAAPPLSDVVSRYFALDHP